MEVIIQSDEQAAALLVARIIAADLRRNPELILGLATGRTMNLVYQRLAWLHREQGLDFSRCRTFNLDEYVGLPPGDPNSYHYYMQEHLFRHLNVSPGRIHLPDGMVADLDAECRNYEALIQQAGGIDLQLLGIGRAGHIAFNEPLSSLQSRTRVKALSPATREQNGKLFGGADKVPPRAITMGVGTILESRRCVLLALGSDKAEVVAKAIEGPVTSMITATALQMHPRCAVVLDEAAASQLTQKDYYRWIFANEPEWQEFQ
ncbi:MAG TPA: glucosamine-6-phosphate deaminase [Candidatus Angelobacter sp.]|nr:glucosamine-6-phosphate deaminase [Candidatus Angelobacter sp.]